MKFKTPHAMYESVARKATDNEDVNGCGLYLCPSSPILVAVDDERETAHPCRLNYDELLALREWVEARINAI